ncbi:MAG: hypothetical protein K2Y30_13000 [Flavobacteriaceae bacterium]|nr:hypothetical protein [Flavobacteriaceae bacterium]
MTTTTVLLLFVSILIAGGLSFFQYIYKAKNKSKVNLFLAFLRFLSLFGVLLLMINPIISSTKLEIIKPPLVIAIDNSSSILNLKADSTANLILKTILANPAIQEKYAVQTYQFDVDSRPLDKVDYKGSQTNLDAVAKDIKVINKNISFPTILISDGNQTNGNDYVYSFNANNAVFPIILGDTTKVVDLKINQLNVNKYAFYKNKFPVEVFLEYSGDKNLAANIQISQGSTILAKENVSFSKTKNTAVVSVLLPADKIGSQVYKATISSLEKEKNTYNNTKNFAVEVIDQKTNVALVSTINHPDIGALKRSIESNAQRKVSIVNPKDIKTLQDYGVLILYQPTTSFKPVIDLNKVASLSSFIITGTQTDFDFLNQIQSSFTFKMTNQKEDYLPSFEGQFNLFAIENIGFESFPPLQNAYGKIQINSDLAVLISAKIRNLETGSPLLSFNENQGKRTAFLFGENMWKWRLQSHIDQQSYEKFDVFIDKIIQYLSSNGAKKSLVVNHESFYNSGDAIEITAQYFNKNYEFDEKARLTIAVINSKTKKVTNYDLLKGSNSYKVNLDGLGAGNYNFKVTELTSNATYTSSFEILDFDIEKQFVNPDIDKLSQLASITKGKLYFPNQIDQVVQSLIQDKNYQSVQKSTTSRSPIIDWYWLLVLISIFLTTEWFVHKYNGLL